MPRKRTAGIWLTGDKKLDKALRALDKRKARPIVRKGVNAAMQELVKTIRSEIPSRQKSARRAIGKSLKKGKFKVGAAVGKKKGAKKKDRRGKPGVGIAAQNIHWLIMGTKDRERWKTGGGPTGSTKPVPAVQRGFRKGARKAMRAAHAKMRKALEDAVKIVRGQGA